MSARRTGFLLGALAMLLLLAVIGLLIVVNGGYNVAATQRHTTIGAWALHTNFTNSVQRQAEKIEAPQLTAAMVAAGAPEYKTMYTHCHGGVGANRAEWAEGMRPKPPALAGAAKNWAPSEVFWLVKHGAKMAGMPAFGETHDDATIWNIAVREGHARYAGRELRRLSFRTWRGEQIGGEWTAMSPVRRRMKIELENRGLANGIARKR